MKFPIFVTRKGLEIRNQTFVARKGWTFLFFVFCLARKVKILNVDVPWFIDHFLLIISIYKKTYSKLRNWPRAMEVTSYRKLAQLGGIVVGDKIYYGSHPLKHHDLSIIIWTWMTHDLLTKYSDTNACLNHRKLCGLLYFNQIKLI